ncbi:hypothetical protein BKD30_01065 [Tersicoccus phoenicis]|uniref:Cytochrome n=1 Tax=Tersicoccus phoenicis TaxID=554083 RepID=A0A1R1LP45_9MICC|nr:cytochrome P450 [Tersicoccus phoenicis]OMH29310.1 hypothetical protein BKD30_01065 [Tersicoccus phoenicis]
MTTTSSATRPSGHTSAGTLDLLRAGYRFMDEARARWGDPAARAAPVRILGRRALLIRGTDAVRFFYDTTRFRRRGAMPWFIKAPLFGAGAVHGLDDETHRHRKQGFFLTATTPDRVDALVDVVDRGWSRALHDALDSTRRINVYRTAIDVYGLALLRWAGVTGTDDELVARARRLAGIVDGFGVPALPWLRAMAYRRDCDAWFTEQIDRVRSAPDWPECERHNPADLSIVELAAAHRDEHGQLLDAGTAAVELQNVVRPTIAVCRFAAFAALALAEHPELVGRVRAETAERGTTVGGPLARAVAHEVRRVYPFVPMLPAKARCPLHFGGHRIRRGQRVLIDILGTNNDPAEWDRPDVFDPDRFVGVAAGEIENFVPQGGGTRDRGHRCPGEGITVNLLAVTVAQLAQHDWTMNSRGHRFPTGRMPTRPVGGPTLRLVR